MSGYTRQSTADIIPTAVVRAAPINAEFNTLRDAFDFDITGSTGHKHDGASDEGSYVPLIADIDGKNKVVINTSNNRVGVFVEVSTVSTEQVRFQDGLIIPVTDNDIDLGSAALEFKNVYVDGTAYLDTVSIGDNDYTTITNNDYTVASGNLTFDVAGDINLDADGGNVALKDSGTTYATFTNNLGNLTLKSGAVTAITFTGANADFAGTVDVTGNAKFDGNATVDGNTVVGLNNTKTVAINAKISTGLIPTTDSAYNLGSASAYWSEGYIDSVTTTGNVSIGGNITVNGSADFTNTTLDNVSDPTTAQQAATKNYVDTADALKLNLSGGTMSGAIVMSTNKITDLGAPTLATDAATKGYVDTSVSALIDAAPGTLDTLNELAAALGDDPNFATSVSTSIATKVSKAGDSMTGNLVMGANKVTSTGSPTGSDDLTRKGYVDDQDVLKLSLSGGTMTGVIAMGGNKITGAGTPTTGSDLTTKTYVDGILGSATAAATSAADAQKLAINPEDSQYTLSDGVTTNFSALHYASKAEDTYNNLVTLAGVVGATVGDYGFIDTSPTSTADYGAI